MIKKQYFKTKDVCRVSFKLEKKQIGTADKVYIVGEFNNWDEKAEPMKKLKNGDFSLVKDLKKDKSYQFRYLVDNGRWVNDDTADAHLPSPFPGEENSVLSL